jgi:hypothetical protein
MAVKYLIDQMAADADIEIKDRRDELFDLELQKYVDGVMGTQYVKKKYSAYIILSVTVGIKGPFSVRLG